MQYLRSLTLTLAALLAPWSSPRRRGALDCIDLTAIQIDPEPSVLVLESDDVTDSVPDVITQEYRRRGWPQKAIPAMLHIPAEIHAKRLFEWVCDGMSEPFQLLSEDVKLQYEEMLMELWWAPPASAASGDFRDGINVSWPQIAGALGVLAARPARNQRGKKLNTKPYVWVATSEGQKRKRVFWFDPVRVTKMDQVARADSVPAKRRKVA